MRRTEIDAFAASLLVVLCLIWGLNQVAIKVANGGLQPVFQAGLRSACGALIVLAWCRIRGVPLFERDGTLFGGILAGLLFGAEFILVYVGLDYTTVSHAIIFLYSMPFVVAIGAHFLIPGERLTRVRALGLVAAFAGVVIAFSDRLGFGSHGTYLGDVLCIIAAIAWGATTLVIRTTRLNTARHEKVLLYQLVVSAVAMLALSPLFGPFIRHVDGLVGLAFAYQVIVVVAASYLAVVLPHRPLSGIPAFRLHLPDADLHGGLRRGHPVRADQPPAARRAGAGRFRHLSRQSAETRMSASNNDPIERVRQLQRPELPKRFYREARAVAAEDGFGLALDGRTARTPARQPLVVASQALAEAIAAEWQGQGERIDPTSMPLTRIVNVAIDRVSSDMTAVRADIVKHAGSDLICYRAEAPAELVERQNALWEPLVAWAAERLGARLRLAEGIIHVAQDDAALSAIARALEAHEALQLAALHTATTLTGSAIIALAVGKGHLTPEAAWEAAHVDEDWQMSQWGKDSMAMARRTARWHEMQAAATILADRL